MVVIALVLALAIHLALMNMALAGPLVCIGLDWMEGKGDKLAGEVVQEICRFSKGRALVGSGLSSWGNESLLHGPDSTLSHGSVTSGIQHTSRRRVEHL